ncbi:DUF3311 domain-containing protein [Sulfoacidibacillus thermotolerans]|uniref:Permease n=1 Tax=Sulfoacidibacillus thermotolerans TaxID=1765684 RepID=A0A2U3DAH3_SULT2|nr:DUF3311 domain-containing protein [Sulfoacidibacillus thermotolerans]PWI58290.1 hypothetical protein BM613_03445 [Sulfoacidibacillus thermotolerans]
MSIRWLALVPVLGILIGVSFANHVTPYVLGMPFLFFYIVLWVILSALSMAVIYKWDPQNQSRGGDR